MLELYRTVKGYGTIEFEINKSRFIAYVDRAETETAALSFIEQIKKRHKDATHNCSAYIIGENDNYQKADDDGEPTGTAGKPILEVIKKSSLKDTVIVVTRYFGGIKLGAGGLIRAYGKSASAGLQAASILKRQLHTQVAIKVEYPLLGIVENYLHTREYQLRDKEFTEKVTLIALVPTGTEAVLTKHLTDLTANRAKISYKDTVYLNLPDMD